MISKEEINEIQSELKKVPDVITVSVDEPLGPYLRVSTSVNEYTMDVCLRIHEKEDELIKKYPHINLDIHVVFSGSRYI